MERSGARVMEWRYGRMRLMHIERVHSPSAIERLALDPPRRRPRITQSYTRALAASIEVLKGLMDAGWRTYDLAYELRMRDIPVAPATVRTALYIHVSSQAATADAQRTCTEKVLSALCEIARLPPPPCYAKPDQLRALKPELRALTRKGVSLQDIVLALREDGINTTEGRLREVLYRAPRTKPKQDTALTRSGNQAATKTRASDVHRFVEFEQTAPTKLVNGAARQSSLFD